MKTAEDWFNHYVDRMYRPTFRVPDFIRAIQKDAWEAGAMHQRTQIAMTASERPMTWGEIDRYPIVPFPLQ